MQSKLPFTSSEKLDIPTLETWLWKAACIIRGASDAPKFKDFILPLIFYKRLSDVFYDELAEKTAEFDDETVVREIIAADHLDAMKTNRRGIVRFYVPEECSWQQVRNHPADGKLGEFLTSVMRDIAKENPDLQGVLDVKDYNEKQSGQRTLDDERLFALIEVISEHRLGMKNTEPDILGRAYEYLLRKFAEGQGQSAGEFYTPKEVGLLMATLINALPQKTIYDPTCGSAGLLIKARQYYELYHPDMRDNALKLFGQELNPVTYAMAKMNMFLHDYTDANFAIGDTMRNPGFAWSNSLRRFHYIVANPMWNQKGYTDTFYEGDREKYNRFPFGTPPSNTADWGWVQLMATTLDDDGRAAIVLDTGAVSRGSGSKSTDRERDIRKKLVECDWIECIVLLPENLFYNTSAPGIILLLNKAKSKEHNGQFLFVNASAFFVKEKPKNALTEAGISAIAEAYRAWETREKLCRLVTLEEVRSADYNLSPSQFVEVGNKIKYRSLSEILADLREVREAREAADQELIATLSKMGMEM